MDERIRNDAPVKAGWITLGITWLLFLIPFPGLGILVASLAFNLLGDGLNEVMNPSLRSR